MTVNNIYKKENIIRVSPEDVLSHVFSFFSSAHDAAFVFDDHKTLLGVVNPYYCLILKSYPSNTKVKHCLFHPPKVDINFSLKKVAQLMIDSKIHYLPVFSHGNFSGIISARRILSAIKDEKEFQMKISEFLKRRKPLISVFEDNFISHALALFKKHKVSKLIVLSKNLKLKGILSYFDLISYLISPKEKQHAGARIGNKVPLLKKYVKNFMKNNVITASTKTTFRQIIDLIEKKKLGSVVIVDRERHPLGIVTTRDIFSLYIGKKDFVPLTRMTKHFSKESLAVVNKIIRKIQSRF